MMFAFLTLCMIAAGVFSVAAFIYACKAYNTAQEILGILQRKESGQREISP